eukprot:5824544-Alexandrium_andersonii.AAC.1
MVEKVVAAIEGRLAGYAGEGTQAQAGQRPWSRSSKATMAQQDELALVQAKLAGLERKLASQQTPQSRASSAGFSTPPPQHGHRHRSARGGRHPGARQRCW